MLIYAGNTQEYKIAHEITKTGEKGRSVQKTREHVTEVMFLEHEMKF